MRKQSNRDNLFFCPLPIEVCRCRRQPTMASPTHIFTKSEFLFFFSSAPFGWELHLDNARQRRHGDTKNVNRRCAHTVCEWRKYCTTYTIIHHFLQHIYVLRHTAPAPPHTLCRPGSVRAARRNRSCGRFLFSSVQYSVFFFRLHYYYLHGRRTLRSFISHYGCLPSSYVI